MRKPLIYIIILNWNGIDDTVECIESIRKIKNINYKIVVIDNGSNNNEGQNLIQKYSGDKNISVIANEVNLGFAGGVNIGINYSIKNRADYTLLLNNDTIVDRSFLTNMIQLSSSDKHIGIVGPTIYYYDHPTEIWSSGAHLNYAFPPFSKKYLGEKPGEVNEIVGCCMLIRNEVFKKVGLFNEKYFAYGEESDFNFRTKKAGFKLYIKPQAKIWHKVAKSTGGGFNKVVAYLKMRNKIVFAKLNLPVLYWPTYFIYITMYFSFHQIKSLYTRKFIVSRSLLAGLVDGVLSKDRIGLFLNK